MIMESFCLNMKIIYMQNLLDHLVHTPYLEVYRNVPHVSPEMSDRIAAMTPARLRFQQTTTGRIWARLALLLLPCLVTDCWPDGHRITAWQKTSPGAD